MAALMVALALAACAFVPAARAGERWNGLTETSFQNYGRTEGLPHPVPTALAQDRDGFLWVGTQGGLARWDGYRFHSYRPDPKQSGSLPDGWVETLHVDPAGTLWIGTGAGGLARYDRDNDRFKSVPLGPAGLNRSHVGAIGDDGEGELWIGTDAGLVHLDPATGKATTLRHDAGDAGSIPDDRVRAVLRDHRGRLWIGTTQGLARRDPGSDRFVALPFGTLPFGTGPNAAASITALFEDAAGRLWIGTDGHGVFVAEPGLDALPQPVKETESGSSPTRGDIVAAICAAGPHEIWVATRGGGIVDIDTKSRRTRRIRHDRTQATSLAHDDVWTLLPDFSGSLWAGGTGGLSYHPKSLNAIETVYGASDRPGGPTEADVYSVLAASDGRVWLGFLGGGVDVFDPAIGRVAQYRPDTAHPDTALPDDVVMGLTEGAGGDVYVGTNRGLYKIDRKGSVASIAVPQRATHASVDAALYDDGMLWLGGVDDGLWGLKLGASPTLAFGPVTAGPLAGQRINCLLRGAGRDLWIGTRNGLFRLDLDTDALEHILPDRDDPTALAAHYVSSLLIDRQGRLWVASFGGGIGVMTGRGPDGKPKFHRLGEADGLPHVNIDKLLLAADGNVWAGTDDGLAMIDAKSFAIRPLNRADGSELVDYFVNAGAVDTAGELLFGAKGGLSVIRPERLEAWDFSPPVVVSDIRVGGQPAPIGRFNGGRAKAPLTLTPATDSLAVEFAALDFTAPDRNQYAYRLDGFDPGWIEAEPSRRLAAYTNLPPGRYTLRLRGSNRVGLWAAHELAIPIQVTPAWYQTIWFAFAAGLLALAAMAAVVRSRTAYLRRRQIELETQVAERTADLRAANDRLFDLATRDSLTGCTNRRRFIERANEMIALGNRHGTPTSLVIMDVDHFKQVNDTYGHPAGDEVLRSIARISQALIRGTDLLGRIGGEEFALLMPHTATPGAELLAGRLREEVAMADSVEGEARIRVTISLGVAQLQPGESFEALYARADAALYAAKQAGRDQVVAF